MRNMSISLTNTEKKKSLAPKLRFREFSDEWERKKIGDIAELTSSKRVYLSDYVNQGIPFYRRKEISELRNNIIPNDILYIAESSYSEFKEKYGVPQKNDILITAVGTLGNVLRIQNDDKFYFKDGNLIWLKGIIESPEFLEIILEVKKLDIEKTSIGSTQRALTMVELRKLIFPFPTLPEQQKIASFLSAIDEKIQQLTRKKELLEQYKKGVMQQLFSGKGRFKSESGKAYPKWEEKPFGAVSTFINGKAYKQEELLKEGKYRVLRVGNLFSNNEWYFSDLELEEDKYIEKGDLIYAWSASFGPRFWVEEKVIYHYHIWKVIPNEEVDKLYLFHAFMFDVERIKAVSQGGTMFHITKGNIESRKFKFPCKEEQQKIASFLSGIDTKIESVGNQITQTQIFKKGLLQQMFV